MWHSTQFFTISVETHGLSVVTVPELSLNYTFFFLFPEGFFSLPFISQNYVWAIILIVPIV